MLYKYPIEQKKTAQETTIGNRRYETDTGAELPPIPYLSIGGATQNNASANGATVKTSAGTNKNGYSDNVGYSSANTAQQSAAAAQLAQKRAALENQYSQKKNLMQHNYNAQKQTAQQANNDALRQLYIAYMQGIKNIPQQSAMWGAGGEIESLKSRHRINYEDNRAKQNISYGDIISEIQQKYNSDLMELEEKYLKQLMSL